VFNQFGDLERCALRPGNVHSAHEWRDVLNPVVARYRDTLLRRYFRGDAAFALPGIYEFLEAEVFKYAIRLPPNTVLRNSIAHLLKRSVGRPPNGARLVERDLVNAAVASEGAPPVVGLELRDGFMAGFGPAMLGQLMTDEPGGRFAVARPISLRSCTGTAPACACLPSGWRKGAFPGLRPAKLVMQ
jgi:hypothetical protein